MKGCRLRCLWCHNPESQAPFPEIGWSVSKCIDCRRCIPACEIHAITIDDIGSGDKLIERDFCTHCAKCVEACPSGALHVIGKYLTVEEVAEEVKKDDVFYHRTGGGVTLSGGEPLLQADFAYQLLTRCREVGIHTALNTSGAVEWDCIARLASATDLVLYDIKHMDANKHRVFTGVGNELILANAVRLALAGKHLTIRFPIIPGYNDSEENVKRTVQFALGLSAEIDFLPYHRLGESKYRKLGRKYKLAGVQQCSAEYILHLKERAGLGDHIRQ